MTGIRTVIPKVGSAKSNGYILVRSLNGGIKSHNMRSKLCTAHQNTANATAGNGARRRGVVQN
jgi:hypothetical protein